MSNMSDNPWLDAQRDWDERYGDLISRARNWRLLALILAICCFLLIAAYVQLSTSTKLVPYVVQVDQLGRSSYGAISDASISDPRLTERALSEWITSWRMVVSDRPLQRILVDRVFAMVAGEGPAQRQVTDWYRDNEPFERASKESVTVEVVAIKQLTGNAWDVEWKEVPHAKNGTQTNAMPDRWRASVVVGQTKPNNEESARVNPLGLFVKEINVSRVRE